MKMEGQNGDMIDILQSEGWIEGAHVFILSSSGKPVYSRNCSEEKLATLSGVMQALVSFVQSSGDSIRRICAGKTTIEFLVAEPVTLVAVSRTNLIGAELHDNLMHLNNLLLFILTRTQLEKIYQERKNFDLRRLLAGSERLIDYLLDNLPLEPGFFLTAVPSHPIDVKTRGVIANTITQACEKLKEIVFGLLILDGRVVCQIRMDRYRLHPFDSLLILNLVASTESLKSGETWSPLCLPQFDKSGFLHAYVSYLAEDCSACLLLLTVNKDIFYELSEAKKRIVAKFLKNGMLDSIEAARSVSNSSPSWLSNNLPQVRHFLYVLTEHRTYFMPRFQAPYTLLESKKALINTYRRCHTRVTGERLKVLFERGHSEAIYGYARDTFQLYIVLEPLTTPEDAAEYKDKLLSWLNKQEGLLMKEDFIF